MKARIFGLVLAVVAVLATASPASAQYRRGANRGYVYSYPSSYAYPSTYASSYAYPSTYSYPSTAYTMPAVVTPAGGTITDATGTTYIQPAGATTTYYNPYTGYTTYSPAYGTYAYPANIYSSPVISAGYTPYSGYYYSSPYTGIRFRR